MDYVSLFSGAGGLEAKGVEPQLCCDIDESAQAVLGHRFRNATIVDDVREVRVKRTDLVVGGWPCQDISVAGSGAGLEGSRSGLFYELLRVARESKATTIVAENVPNLLSMNSGATMLEVLRSLSDAGFPFVAWRTLNARSFGLPHQRRRVFIVASRDKRVPANLHRPIPRVRVTPKSEVGVAGFYTTAGLQSICYSAGYTPTLKVGSSISIPSPPGLYFGSVVRKATSNECLKLQGFNPRDFRGIPEKDRYRLSGNAVAVPVGRFAVETAVVTGEFEPMTIGHSRITTNGMFIDGMLTEVANVEAGVLAANLADFVDTNNVEQLSPKAASGLLTRLSRSGKPCPEGLRAALANAAGVEGEFEEATVRSESAQTRRADKKKPRAPQVESIF